MRKSVGSALAVAGLCCVGVCASALVVGCSQEADAVSAETERGPADQSYTVRGRIVNLPGEGPTGQPLNIHHERIPEFVGSDGQVHVNADGSRGMAEMVMPFPELAEGVSLAGLEAGDEVEFRFDVWWEGTAPFYAVMSIETLPVGTELDLGGMDGGGMGEEKEMDHESDHGMGEVGSPE